MDNYDSFTYNLLHQLVTVTGFDVHVISYSDFSSDSLNGYDHLFISPGPGKPEEYPKFNILPQLNIKVTGICLGMQIINTVFGGRVEKLEKCIHGKTSIIRWQGKPYEVARYHSLYCSETADGFNVEAVTDDGAPMIISSSCKRFKGFQFHPESFMSKNGGDFIRYASSI